MTSYISAVSIPAIVAAVYTIIDLAKTAVGESEKFKRFIPLIATGIGALIGALLFYVEPGIIAAHNLLTAIVIGAASGLTATGTNQVVKQLSDKNTDNKDEGSDKE
jgi:uncharacterized membrane protein